MRILSLVAVGSAIVTVCLVLVSCSDGCDQGGQSPVAETIRGELIALDEVTRSFFDDDTSRASIDTGDQTVSFAVHGQGELLEIGASYEVELRLWDPGDPASRYATINSSDTCDGAPNSSIWLLDDDGRVDIEQPGRFRSPISLSNFLLGFGAFVVLIAVFGRSREM